MMTITVRLFARVREVAGAQQLKLVLPLGATVADLRTALVDCIPALGPLLEVSAVAVNHDFAEADRVLVESDEVAIIPPVSGG